MYNRDREIEELRKRVNDPYEQDKWVEREQLDRLNGKVYTDPSYIPGYDYSR